MGSRSSRWLTVIRAAPAPDGRRWGSPPGAPVRLQDGPAGLVRQERAPRRAPPCLTLMRRRILYCQTIVEKIFSAHGITPAPAEPSTHPGRAGEQLTSGAPLRGTRRAQTAEHTAALAVTTRPTPDGGTTPPPPSLPPRHGTPVRTGARSPRAPLSRRRDHERHPRGPGRTPILPSRAPLNNPEAGAARHEARPWRMDTTLHLSYSDDR